MKVDHFTPVTFEAMRIQPRALADAGTVDLGEKSLVVFWGVLS